ncbi:calcium-binding protein [Bosea sp. LjRoot90]|uniref:calcium-binding protein n=1 Tax=Bosea sp. LjRoot90 TaxID=3342342 RepID=UPI003F503DDE
MSLNVRQIRWDGTEGNDSWVADDITKSWAAYGNGCDDHLTGGSLGDTLSGGDGFDVIHGGGGNDRLYGGEGQDQLYGGDGNDLIDGGGQYDLIYGGNGNDVVLGGGIAYGEAGNDTLYGSDERDIMSGGDGNDTLNGGNGADFLLGGAGSDTIHSGGDNSGNFFYTDELQGDGGKDFLYGDLGRDVFVYWNVSDSAPGAAARDVIYNFTQGADDIQLAIDANANTAEQEDFAFIGRDAFSGEAGQLRYEISNGSTFVSGDVNGDSLADFEIELVGEINLTASDFMY